MSNACKFTKDGEVALRVQKVIDGRNWMEFVVSEDAAFAGRSIDPAGLKSRIGIATLQGEFRLVHLETHLAQRALLAAEQIARYDALRGYAGEAPLKRSIACRCGSVNVSKLLQ